MPLPSPAPRRPIHRRSITAEAFLREDGLWDIDARLLDTKPVPMRHPDPQRGTIPAGAPVHQMALRLTVDDAMVVRAAVASAEHAPFDPCGGAAGLFAELAGMTLGPGWRGQAQARIGGLKGCTHLSELLVAAVTVAFQAVVTGPDPEHDPYRDPSPGTVPFYLDGCRSWDRSGEVVRRLFPRFHRPAEPDGAD